MPPKVDELRDLARRVRRLAHTLHQEAERLGLLYHAQQLEEQALRLDMEAARSHIIPPSTEREG